MNGNASFVGFYEETGHIYRIEINKKITGRANHIRSVFEITPSNYNEIKLEPPRVLQPSKTALLKGRAATMPISNFMNKIPPNDSKVNPTSTKNSEKSSNGAVFSTVGDLEQNKRPYYDIPFAEIVDKVIDPTNKTGKEPVFVSETPSIYQEIVFTALPMMMNQRHLRLNYFTEQEFEERFGKIDKDREHAHGLHDEIKKLKTLLEHPLAVVVNQSENAKPNSVVAITTKSIGGKKIVISVLIEAVTRTQMGRIDSHLVLTVFDSNNWIEKFLKPAMELEKKKQVGIFYFDPKKASDYGLTSALAQRLTGTGHSPGILHNIADIGINVKPQTETLQFKKYFGNWQDHPEKASKVVDDEGKPLIVYNGGKSGISIFDIEQTGKSNEFAKVGFWFSDEKSLADSFAKKWYNQTWNGKEYAPGNVYAVYLNIKNPQIYEFELTHKMLQGVLRNYHDFSQVN